MSEQAVEAARKTVALSPGYSMAWQNLAFGLRDFSDHAGAVEAFEQADKTGPLEPPSFASWGESLGVLGRHAEGEQMVRRALDGAPDDAAILTLLGWLLVEQRKDVEARDVFKKSLELKANQFLAAFNYGVLLLRVSETEAALRWLRRATSINPKSAAAWRVLALELHRHGLNEEAVPAAERCLRLAPEDGAVRALLAKLKAVPGAEAESTVIDFSDPAPLGPASDAAKREKKSDGSGESTILDLSTINFGD
jgi:tetratricopeptide (TPR) repeat protein